MKKLALPLVLILTLSTLSCKKEYTCKCYLRVYWDTNHQIIYNKDTIKSSRKAADKRCESYNIKTPTSPDSLYCYAYTDQ